MGTNVPQTRDAQLEGLTQPYTAFATAVDLGDSTSPYNDIHPRYKQQVYLPLSFFPYYFSLLLKGGTKVNDGNFGGRVREEL